MPVRNFLLTIAALSFASGVGAAPEDLTAVPDRDPDAAEANILYSRLAQISMANTLYANDHQGRHSIRFDELVERGYITVVPAPTRSMSRGWIIAADNVVYAPLQESGAGVCRAFNVIVGVPVDYRYEKGTPPPQAICVFNTGTDGGYLIRWQG